ncbi:YceK/YidQ family lipoprotein [Leptospira ellisii]|uniref:YceK/YidQ family lipoprotein n=1 Tax=Leptospira ellisii TaxID=2023197 RepID=A0A2N0BQ56_9LEPT|nr:YceK/YidQ family lipoprotein [Leptospira ellisii]PKA06139.1 YceK/YidQ family lipoprotein [Leptospira ellisii]
MGHPYVGTQISITSFLCLVELSSILFYVPVPFVILNVPLSFIMDTILLPVDLIIKPERKRPTLDDRYCDAP